MRLQEPKLIQHLGLCYVSGPFITEAYVTCPPSTEKFKVSPAELVPATEKPSDGSRKKPSVTDEHEEDELEAVAN